MDITSLLIQLVSGAVGGNVAGAAMKKSSLGVGGVETAAGGDGMTAILSSIAGGGAGGAVLLAIVGAIRGAMAKKG